MKKILIKDFTFYYKHSAIFFNEAKIIVYPNKNTPFMNFKDGLDHFGTKVQEVFLDKNLLFVELDQVNDTCNLDIYSSKVFLREMVDDNINHMLKAIQWLTWTKKNRYCSKCGNVIDIVQNVLEKKCDFCNLSFYPNLSPAVMILLKRENQILLARSPHFRKGMYSALAGFVDIGETAENAAHREVQEEVGLKIKSLEYFGSQSWPFPNSFMIAFTAEYLDGEIIMEPNEIEDAKWFDLNHLPDLPSMPSISRKLIDATVEKLKTK